MRVHDRQATYQFLPTSPSAPGAVRRTATPRVKTALIATGALVACASLAAACGVVPGISGGSGDDTVTVMTWAPQNTSATNKPGMPAMASAYAAGSTRTAASTDTS